MRRAGLLLTLVLLAGACGKDSPVRSVAPGPAPCPDDGLCTQLSGDVDGDGAPDLVTRWGKGDHVGVTVDFAHGPTVRHPFAAMADDYPDERGGLGGVASLDDEPGDEIVAFSFLGMAGGPARILRWDGHDLVEVADPTDSGPINGGSGIDQHGSWGFSCEDDGLQVYALDRDPWTKDAPIDGDVHRYTWDHGRLVDAGTEHLVVGPDGDGNYAGTRCAGFRRLPWADDD